jgi:cobalt-zinc-cadmium efflux system outer membrane protein
MRRATQIVSRPTVAKIAAQCAALALTALLAPVFPFAVNAQSESQQQQPSPQTQQPPQSVPQPAEPAADSGRPRITFTDYINEVLRSNVDLAAQRANIAIGKAAITTAKITPDWSVDVGLPTVDISNQGQATNVSAGLNIPIELGGKRGRRIRAATSDLAATSSHYDDAVRQLRATAAGAFIDALSAREILGSKNKSLGQLDRIVNVNQERLRVGDIGEIELSQSRVDRDQFKADVITALADVYSADLVLGQQLSRSEKLAAELPVPSGTLEIPIRTFEIDRLVADALQHRSDVLSRQHAVQAASDRIELARVNLIPDLSVSGSYSHTGSGTGGFSQPPDSALGASFSINLPFSRWRYQGEMENAQASRTQAELQLRSTQLQVEAEVREAYSRYQASVQRLQLYRGGMLKDADRVLEARLYAYQHGSATLLEVIDAQKTSAAIYLAYSQALTDHAHTLVTLQQAAAIWDVSF